MGGVGSVVYPPVLSEQYSTQFQYGIGIYIDNDKKTQLVAGYWAVHFIRAGGGKEVAKELWIKKENIVLSTTRAIETINEVAIELKDKLAHCLEDYLEIISEKNGYILPSY